MDEELKHRIAEDLKKAGRASEMLAIETFIRRGWSCEGSVGFHDKDGDISREFDIHAHRPGSQRLEDGGSVQVTFRIAGEVKKSEKPWVALRERSLGDEDLTDAWANLTHGVNLPDERFALDAELSRYSLLQTAGWRARAVHEAFKHPNASEASHAAFIVACKAAESALEAEEASLAQLRAGFADSIFLTLVKPVVILDGVLVSATLDEDASIEIEPVGGAALGFQFRTARYTREVYSIDVVTLEYLDTYLELCERRIDSIVSALSGKSTDRRGGR